MCTDQHLFLLEMIAMFKNNCSHQNRKSILRVGFSILYPTSVLTKKGLMLNIPQCAQVPSPLQGMLEINRPSMVTMPLGWNGFLSNSLGVNYAIIHSPHLGKFNLVLALPSGIIVLSSLVPHFGSSFWELHSPSRDSGGHTFCCPP